MAAQILEEFEASLGTIELVPGGDGVFDVHVGGDLVFTKAMVGRYPEPDDVMPLLRPHLVACIRR